MRGHEVRIVALCGADARVPKQMLHGADILAVLQQPAGEGITESMRMAMQLCLDVAAK